MWLSLSSEQTILQLAKGKRQVRVVQHKRAAITDLRAFVHTTVLNFITDLLSFNQHSCFLANYRKPILIPESSNTSIVLKPLESWRYAGDFFGAGS